MLQELRCDIDAIDAIAKKHNLKVIYDAAHCFGSQYKGQSVLNFGDISTISFHATKLFHSTEGGAVITTNADLLKKMAHLRNFGHDGPEKFECVGINGKNSEFHAAMGLCNLPYADHIIEKRRKDSMIYNTWLDKLNLQKPKIDTLAKFNHAYYPVVFKTEEDCLKVFKALEREWIYARRYFYPVLSSLNYVKYQEMPVAESISTRILCLPLFEQITQVEIDMICRIIIRTLKY